MEGRHDITCVKKILKNGLLHNYMVVEICSQSAPSLLINQKFTLSVAVYGGGSLCKTVNTLRPAVNIQIVVKFWSLAIVS